MLNRREFIKAIPIISLMGFITLPKVSPFTLISMKHSPPYPPNPDRIFPLVTGPPPDESNFRIYTKAAWEKGALYPPGQHWIKT